MPRRRLHRPALREAEIHVLRHIDASDRRSTAPREFLRRLPGGDANRVIDAVRRGRLGAGTYRLEGRLSGASRRIVWARIVTSDLDMPAPAPVSYGSAAEVTLAAQSPVRDTARRADLVAVAEQVRDHETAVNEIAVVVQKLVQRIHVLEVKETTRAACDLAAQRARRLGLP